jgi:hypothetical protein
MRKLAAALLVLLAPPAAGAACGPHTVPAPAAAHGFTCETFWDDFTSLVTIDLGDTRKQGFKWYPHSHYGITTSPAAFSIVAGGLQLSPTTDTSNDVYNMTTCPGSAGESGGWNDVVGGMYVNIKVSVIAAQPATQPRWWPAFWMEGSDAIRGSRAAQAWPNDNPEIDLLEMFYGGAVARYLHNWYTPPAGTPVTDNGSATYVASPSFANGNTYGALVLKPEQNGGVGTIVGYLNDVVEASSTPKTWTNGGLYRGYAEVPLCVLLTAGYTWPIVVRSVQVWQAPSGFKGRF